MCVCVCVCVFEARTEPDPRILARTQGSCASLLLQRDQDGSTPLHVACVSRQPATPHGVLRYLLRECPQALGATDAAGSSRIPFAFS